MSSAAPIRTVVWSTGGVGAVAVDAIRRRPDMELVGVWVHSPEKVGRDAGELAGGAPIGVTATNDAGALIGLRPDCVVYAASGPERDGAAVPDYLRLLQAGINVVSTSSTSLVYPPSYFSPDWRDQLETAAKTGHASLYVSGIFPGFGSDQLALLMTTQSKCIRSITVSEVALNDHYPVADVMVNGMGFGHAARLRTDAQDAGFHRDGLEGAYLPDRGRTGRRGGGDSRVAGPRAVRARHRSGVRHHRDGYLRCGADSRRGCGQRAGGDRGRARHPDGTRCRTRLAEVRIRRDVPGRHRRAIPTFTAS